MDKIKYQVFISSTYVDLKIERKQVLDILLMADCIPAGMEAFVATDDEQFNVIKRVIDLCDYYILIIGKRYGSVNESTGLSYTEMEYDYAISKGIPVLVFAIDDTVKLESDKVETDDIKRGKLAQFKNKAMKNRLASIWRDSSDLMGKVAIAIMQAKNEINMPGWVRATSDYFDDKINFLEQINALRIENDKLKQEINYKDNEIKFFGNNLAGAFSNIFNESTHINELRVYCSSSATILPKIVDEIDLTVDECTVLLRKLPNTDDLFNKEVEIETNGLVTRWRTMVTENRIKKLTIVNYDRFSDMWYVIFDKNFLLTDLFTLNSEKYWHYGLSKNKSSMVVSSITENGGKYVSRYIDQFDNYVQYYKNKENCGILYKSY